MDETSKAFDVQGAVRGPWREYLDGLAPLRPDLFRYCRRLTGNVWDAEDLAQEALAKVFSLLGKIDIDLENPRAYLIRTATNLWIDAQRREAKSAPATSIPTPGAYAAYEPALAHGATHSLFSDLHPQERAALVLQEALDLSLEEIAGMLHTTEGAVESALSRARGRLDGRRSRAGLDAPPREVVAAFLEALRARDIPAIKALCADNMRLELVGGAEAETFDAGKVAFEHAHAVTPMPGFGANPRWELRTYEDEPVVLGFRTLDGAEGLNEVWRFEHSEGAITRARLYCFTPDVLAAVAQDLGLPALQRPYRSPSPPAGVVSAANKVAKMAKGKSKT